MILFSYSGSMLGSLPGEYSKNLGPPAIAPYCSNKDSPAAETLTLRCKNDVRTLFDQDHHHIMLPKFSVTNKYPFVSMIWRIFKNFAKNVFDTNEWNLLIKIIGSIYLGVKLHCDCDDRAVKSVTSVKILDSNITG